jgi:hypothetical protein
MLLSKWSTFAQLLRLLTQRYLWMDLWIVGTGSE